MAAKSLEALKINSALIRLEEATEDFEAIDAHFKKTNVIDTDLLFGVVQRLRTLQSLCSELEQLA